MTLQFPLFRFGVMGAFLFVFVIHHLSIQLPKSFKILIMSSGILITPLGFMLTADFIKARSRSLYSSPPLQPLLIYVVYLKKDNEVGLA